MDVIPEIKKFEQHPDRAHFSALQLNDFYKNLIGQPFKFEAIISSVRKGVSADYEIMADTYAYAILHNPVADRDYINWAPDLSFICEAGNDIFKFNPITDLIKGDRFHCSAVFLVKEQNTIRVKLTSFQKIQFLEVEREKDLLEKRFQDSYEELTVFAPQRQSHRNLFNRVFLFTSIGALIGLCLGLFWGCIRSFIDSNESILSYGVEGTFIFGFLAAALGLVAGLLKPRSRM